MVATMNTKSWGGSLMPGIYKEDPSSISRYRRDFTTNTRPRTGRFGSA